MNYLYQSPTKTPTKAQRANTPTTPNQDHTHTHHSQRSQHNTYLTFLPITWHASSHAPRCGRLVRPTTSGRHAEECSLSLNRTNPKTNKTTTHTPHQQNPNRTETQPGNQKEKRTKNHRGKVSANGSSALTYLVGRLPHSAGDPQVGLTAPKVSRNGCNSPGHVCVAHRRL